MHTRRYCIIIIIISAFLLFSCKRNVDPVSQSGFFFDTVTDITLYDGRNFSESDTSRILSQCLDMCSYYENLFSSTIEGSDISRINSNAGFPVRVSDETLRLIKNTLDYCRLTDGKLDISILPVSELWQFTGSHHVPSAGELDALLPHVDYSKITVDEEHNTVCLSDPAAAISLGCVAKGYIADRLKEYLISEGITGAVINLGGNVLTLGTKPDGLPFNIGIKKPFSDGEIITVRKLSGQSLVSSGTYERYFEKDGIIYHHILDTATGYPLNNSLCAVSILSDSSFEGDALSTTCFILGPEKGLALIESLPGTECMFVTGDLKTITSSGW